MVKRSRTKKVGDRAMSRDEIASYLEDLRHGMRSAYAVRRIQRSKSSVVNRRNRDPDFAAQEEAARAEWRATLCRAVHQAVAGGDVATARWALERLEMTALEKAKLEEIRARTAESVARTAALKQRIDPDEPPQPDPRFD